MKKLSLFLALTMLCTATPVALAENSEYENLILTVKNRVGVPAEYTYFQDINKYENNDMTYYAFAWRNPEDKYEYVNVTADSAGNIVNYSFSDGEVSYEASEYAYITINMENAKNTALDFIKRTNPELADNVALTLSSYNYSDEVRFDITGIFNGIEYYKSIGSVNVSDDMTVTLMRLEAPDIKESDSEYISQDEAYKLYMDKIGVETNYYTYMPALEYMKVNDVTDYDLRLTFPAYSDIENKAIDAVTGEVIELYTYSLYKEAFLTANGAVDESASDLYDELTEEEIKEIEEISNLLSEDEALKIIKDRTGINIVPDSSSLNFKDEYYYSFYDEDKYVHISVNAENGDITEFSFVFDEVDKDTSLFKAYDLNDREKAAELIRKLAPIYGASYEVKETGDNAVLYEYKVNGIPVSGVQAHFRKDAEQGYYSFRLTSLYRYANLEYDKPEKFIPVSEQFSDSALVKLRYIDTENGIKAAYIIVGSIFVNALTGKSVDYNNTEKKPENISAYTDIENHWVKTAAEQLAYAKIGFDEPELNPDIAITEQEAYDLLNKIYYIGEKTLEHDTVTRREAAELIIEAIGLNDIAGMDIFIQPYSDTPDNYGAVAILKGYGIIAGDTDTFRPNDNITRAEFLQMLYNTLLMR